MGKTLVAVVLGIALVGAGDYLVVAQNHPPTRPGSAHGEGPIPADGSTMHTEPVQAPKMMGTPRLPGQDAFGAIAEIVGILEADAATDWTKVDIERLRQHLIDMKEVVLRSAVRQTRVPGGLAMEVTGTGRTERAIRAMVVPHAAELDCMPEWSARAEIVPGGVRLIVLARSPDEAALVARIRGLGFAGLITQGAHHQRHHLAMARGDASAGHTH
jgi:hypothetical protein